MPSHGSGSQRSVREALLLVGCGFFVVVQALLPALLQRQPEREVQFTWELYAKGALPVEFTLIGPSGSWRLTLGELVASPSAGPDYASHLPPFLCSSRPDLEAVQVREGDSTWSHRCP